MSRIRLLDDATVNKIAAGEVIERPASVVKELVENSIDAGATEIRIRIEGAGKAMIEVADNGCGMSPDDLEMAFVQHATSKISSIDDLESLGTMGFRGEALSSIAAVADVEISAREADSDIGHSLAFAKGKPGNVKTIGRPQGTTVTVRNLFAGHPARLKYLKGDKVEMAHVAETVTERALVNPNVAFTLHNDGVEMLNLPSAERMQDRIGDVMGRKVARELTFFETEDRGMRIVGYLAKPAVTRSTRSGLYIFVNSRPVSSPAMSEAVETGYAGMLMRNRHPVGVLMLDMDPATLDVNVHPTKRVVKFADEKRIAGAITDGAMLALGNSSLIPEVRPRQRELFPVEHAPGKPVGPRHTAGKHDAVQRQLVDDAAAGDAAPGELPEGRTMPAMRVIGQILDTYILAQSGSDLLIIDQHAAHERVMLDRLKARPVKKAGQNLITPVPITLDKRESQLLEHYRPVIEELGFKIEPFGRDTYLVRAVPAIGGHIESERGLLDLIHELAELGKAKSIEEKRDEIMHLVACHSAIRAGETLTMQRMVRLVEEMKALENPYTCAHGRPTIVRMTGKDLEKMFKRIV